MLIFSRLARITLIQCWGIVLFHSFLFSVHIDNRLRSPYLSVHVIIFVLLFSRAWGIFENFFFRAGQAHSLAGFGLRAALRGQPMGVTAVVV